MHAVAGAVGEADLVGDVLLHLRGKGRDLEAFDSGSLER